MYFFLLLAAGLAVAGQAPKAKHNPKNIIAVADFPEFGPNSYTKGYVYFTSHKGGAVKVHVDMTGLPQSGGPFFYHIHEKQVFSGEDCNAAGAAFDPYGGLQKCPRVGDDSFCQVGDLSGKHGWINATCYQAEYTDPYLALNPQSDAYIVGRSLVFHTQDSRRFACANINIATKEQYEALFGYHTKSESESDMLEFADAETEAEAEAEANTKDAEAEAEAEANTKDAEAEAETEVEAEADTKEANTKEAETIKSKADTKSEADSESDTKLADTKLADGAAESELVREVESVQDGSGNFSNYVPAEAGAGNVLTGMIGTALGLALGFFV